MAVASLPLLFLCSDLSQISKMQVTRRSRERGWKGGRGRCTIHKGFPPERYILSIGFGKRISRYIHDVGRSGTGMDSVCSIYGIVMPSYVILRSHGRDVDHTIREIETRMEGGI